MKSLLFLSDRSIKIRFSSPKICKPSIMSESTSSSSNSGINVVLISSHGDKFMVDYKALAMESELIKSAYEVDEGDRRHYREVADVYLQPLELDDVPTKTLIMVINYCMNPGDKTDYSKFLKLKPRTLARLIVAACYMEIGSLLDLTCLALRDIINKMSPENICKTLDISTDEFTTQNVDSLYKSFPNIFQANKQRLTPDESAHLTKQEKKMMNKQYFLQKVLPAISPAQFTYLTPEEKKEWVLVAVFRRHWNQKLTCTLPKYNLYSTDYEKKPANLDKVSVRREGESQTIAVDLASLFVKKFRNENVSSKNWVFQFFSVCVEFRSDKPGGLYGLIDAKGNGCPDYISLFNSGRDEFQPIANNGLVSLTDPSPCGLISATRNIDMRVQLFVRIDDENDEDDEDLKLSLVNLFWDCSSPRYNKNFGCFENVGIKSEDGSVKVYYIVLDNPVEATVDVLIRSHGPFYGFGKIVASYGDIASYFRPSDENQCSRFGTFKCGIEEAGYCKITLFEASRSDPVYIVDGKLPLTRSKLVVPNGDFLVIAAGLEDIRFPNRNLYDAVEIGPEPGGTSSRHIDGLRCMMTVNVDWKTP